MFLNFPKLPSIYEQKRKRLLTRTQWQGPLYLTAQNKSSSCGECLTHKPPYVAPPHQITQFLVNSLRQNCSTQVPNP